MTNVELRQALISGRPVVYADPLAGIACDRPQCGMKGAGTCAAVGDWQGSSTAADRAGNRKRRCRRVCAVRITRTEEGMLTSAEVLDRHTGTVMVVRPERLRYAEENYD